ncbi:MAG: NAD-binding protein [Spirochaetales bacterium]|nr:NAD-binding protein [Spirochaetales bacterium]
MNNFEYISIGSGQGGTPLAVALAQADKKTALVENRHVGGYIGLEFGQMFRRFGSSVSIVYRGDQLLSRENGDIAAEVLKILQEDGIDYRVSTMPMSWVARALEVDEKRGLIKVLVDPKSQQILGCAILGIEGGEIMAMLQIAMMAGLLYTTLRDGIFAHPTLAESLNNLFTQVG